MDVTRKDHVEVTDPEPQMSHAAPHLRLLAPTLQM